MTALTTAEVAVALETTPRELRKFLRADAKSRGEATPGKGARYSLPGSKRDLTALAKRFTAWQEAKAPAPEAEVEAIDEVDAPDAD